MTYAQQAQDRLIDFTRSTRFMALMAALAAKHDEISDEIPALLDAFNLNSASPNLAALEQLGTILQRPNPGYSASRYQALLKVQARLLAAIPNTRTILDVVDDFTGIPPTAYAEAHPLGYEVGAVATGTDRDILIELLELVRPATYSVTVTLSSTVDVLMVDSAGSNTLADPGNVGTAGAGPVTDDYDITGVVVV